MDRIVCLRKSELEMSAITLMLRGKLRSKLFFGIITCFISWPYVYYGVYRALNGAGNTVRQTLQGMMRTHLE